MTGLGELQLIKSGWLEKYSVGRGIIPLKNWQRRWFCVDHAGLNYSKTPTEAPSKRTFIPFVAGAGADGDILMAPVYLYPNVTESVHPEATGSNIYYFALRFQERGTPRVLLVRMHDPGERESWVRFLAQFIQAAALSGIPSIQGGSKKGIDPDELDPKERLLLKQTIMDWDEGCQNRVIGAPEPAVPPDAFDDCTVWASDEESGHASRRGSKSNANTPSAQSPRARPAPGNDDYDCL